MSDTIEVIELIINGVSVYRSERTTPSRPFDKVIFKHYIADALTGEEIK